MHSYVLHNVTCRIDAHQFINMADIEVQPVLPMEIVTR